MSQSLANVAVHLIFSTKDRLPWLANEHLQENMHKQLVDASKVLMCPALIAGGVADHIHLLGRIHRTSSISEWVKGLKRVTSIWVKQQGEELQSFQWQAGYGAFAVSQSETPRVIRYIQNQAEHHRRFDFKTEYRRILQLHEIPYDEGKMWE